MCMIDFDSDSYGREIPEHTRKSLDNYLVYGLPPGGFLTNVLCNNLYGAISNADHINIQRLPDIVRWLNFNAPPHSYGHPEGMKYWMTDPDGMRKRYAERVEKEYTWRVLRTRGEPYDDLH